jgi:hypothetical protein
VATHYSERVKLMGHWRQEARADLWVRRP